MWPKTIPLLSKNFGQNYYRLPVGHLYSKACVFIGYTKHLYALYIIPPNDNISEEYSII